MFIAPNTEIHIMSVKNKKQFGIWMDSQNATIIGREENEAGNFKILAHEKNVESTGNSSEHSSNNAERSLQNKYFKGIVAHMQNIDEVHITGTGQVQEQFVKFLAESPQFKNAVSKQSTSNKMSDEKLVDFISSQF